MKYFALLYDLVDDMVNRRAPFREEHLRLGRESLARGELVFGGALTDPVDKALIIFHTDDRDKVEDFARKDPYVTNGLAKKWEIRPWNVVIGGQESTQSPRPGSILRRWSARSTESQLPHYLEHFSKNVLPELRQVPGYLGANLSLRRANGQVEIVVETIWESLVAIRNFAGPDVEAAVVADQAAALLTSYDRRVQHSEIALSDHR
jgi:uncharacterized protein YciI/heme-degrading monooxygenase HmoA